MTASVTGAKTTIMTLLATKIPVGSKAAVRRATALKGCPFTSKVATVKFGKSNLLALFGAKRTLKRGALPAEQKPLATGAEV